MGLSQRRGRVLRRLRRRKTREREGLVLVEGVRAVREALAAGATGRFAIASPALHRVPEGAAVRRALDEAGVEVDEIEDGELASLADTEHPQGILFVCVEPPAGDEDVRPGGRYLVLDAVQDPGNVGTLVRSATAFALDAVVALDGTADVWGPKAVRASAGTAFRQPLLVRAAEDAVALFGRARVALLVADASGDDVAEVARPLGWALVVGNEGSGPRPSIREAAGRLVRVPMPGPAESLNAGVAGAVLLYALTREETRAAR
jgi:TrmH family RNA methyltransferase